jgi:hypothetical protein
MLGLSLRPSEIAAMTNESHATELASEIDGVTYEVHHKVREWADCQGSIAPYFEHSWHFHQAIIPLIIACE